MRRPDFRYRVRNLMIGVAVAAVGLFLIRANWDRGDEVIVRQYSGDWRPWNRGRELRVRLDLGRLRAYGFSRKDVMYALTPSTMVEFPDPPRGVVYVTRLGRPDQLENIILKANPEGDLIRLKDVARVEAGW